MNTHEYNGMLDELISAAADLYADHDLGFPQTYADFERGMWQSDRHMNQCGATREEYTDAMKAAYEAVS